MVNRQRCFMHQEMETFSGVYEKGEQEENLHVQFQGTARIPPTNKGADAFNWRSSWRTSSESYRILDTKFKSKFWSQRNLMKTWMRIVWRINQNRGSNTTRRAWTMRRTTRSKVISVSKNTRYPSFSPYDSILSAVWDWVQELHVQKTGYNTRQHVEADGGVYMTVAEQG